VSIISFIGLTSDDERQQFVSQLHMALLAWVKRIPAGNQAVSSLLVMDEAHTFSPSLGSAPSTVSSIALVAQARKYGLGLVFATHAPKGLHPQVSGNAGTQFFGLLNSPIQIDAARDLAAARGGRISDIGTLTSGQFYAAMEGRPFARVDTPMCLSHHDAAPLAPEQVRDRARRTAHIPNDPGRESV